MTIQTINLGNYANDGTGDDLRTAFEKVNANFNFLNVENTTSAQNLGAGEFIFAQKSGNTLQFKSLFAGQNITLASDGNTITISGSGNLQSETSPTLGANLNMNGFNIIGGGNIESLIYGIDIRTLVGASGDLDFGTFSIPSTFDIDFGAF
jgi:hypothetical protein